MSDRIDTAGERRLQAYLSHVTAVLGHADRKQRLVGYCIGLLLPGERGHKKLCGGQAAAAHTVLIWLSLARPGYL